MSKPRVFVTQEMDRLDYSPAEKFGDVVFLTRSEFSHVKSSLGNIELVRQIRDRLADFNAEIDFVVCSGSPTVAAAVFAIIGRKCGRWTILRWSNRDFAYNPVEITIGAEV